MPSVRAAVARQFGKPLEIEQIDLRAPLNGELEITLAASAICHSDISYIDGIWGGELPAVYGHEGAGIVSAVGDGTAQFNVGDRVIVSLIKSCGICSSCSNGKPAICSDQNSNPSPITDGAGKPVVQAMNCGAFAEKVVVDQSQVVKIPNTIPMDVACLLSCGVITGVGSVINTADVRPGQSVVVIGAGGVGLNAVQGARIAGATNIIAVDLVHDKLDAAIEFGATHSINGAEKSVVEEISRITKGKMADCVLVTVGAIRAYEDAPEMLATGGKLIMVGMPHADAEAKYSPVNFAASGQSMIGSKMGDVVLQRDIPWLIELYIQGRLKLDELVSNRWKLEDINEAIADTKTGGARRNVVIFDETA